MTTEILSRQCNCCKISKPLDEFNRDKNLALGRKYQCRACKSVEAKVRRERQPEKSKSFYANNRSAALARAKEYYEINRERKLAYLAEYRKKNADRLKEQRAANQWRVTRSQAARRAKLKHASLGLGQAFVAEIEGFYRFCSLFSGFEVDHIVPLANNKVCGLHAPWNLQVVPQLDNRRKKNRFDILMWPLQGEVAYA